MNTALTPLEQFKIQVLPAEKAADLWKSLPSHIKPALFERNLMNALMNNADLLKCPPHLVYREVSKAASLGLLLDPLLGEAYLVLAWNSKTGQREPQLRIGYRGMLKLTRQGGEVTSVYAHEVHSLDPFHVSLGTERLIEHKPHLFRDRGEIVGYYAVIKFSSGDFDFEPMTIAQVRGIRDRSDAWRAFKEGKIKSTPWASDEDEMAKKTVLRRLLKRQSQSSELAEAIGIEDAAEHSTMRDVTPARNNLPPPPPTNVTVTSPPPGTTVWNDPEPEDEPPADTPPPPPPPGPAAAPPPPQNKLRQDQSLPPPPPRAKAASAAEIDMWLDELANAFNGCEDLGELSQEQLERMTPERRASMPPSAWRQANVLLQAAADRINRDTSDG